MVEVDEHDDTRTRYVVRRYAYDPWRHERRHQTLAVFDDEREYQARIDREAAQLDDLKRRGLVDPQEHITGVVKVPGDDERARAGRLLGRRVQHGV